MTRIWKKDEGVLSSSAIYICNAIGEIHRGLRRFFGLTANSFTLDRLSVMGIRPTLSYLAVIVSTPLSHPRYQRNPRSNSGCGGAVLRNPRLILKIHSDQTGRAFVRHESAGPAISRVKILFVAPRHSELATILFFPAQPIVSVPLPRGRMASHEIEIERGGPAKCTVSNRNGWIVHFSNCIEHKELAIKRQGELTILYYSEFDLRYF